MNVKRKDRTGKKTKLNKCYNIDKKKKYIKFERKKYDKK